MCEIILFPTNRIKKYRSEGYENLTALFEICSDLETCNEYLDMVEYMSSQNMISETEKYTLRRIGRQKRIDLAQPEKKSADKAEKPGTYFYTPEMGQEKPDCQIEAQLSYYGKHYHLKTALELKGRGITKEEDYSDGTHCYTVTRLAYEKLEKIYTISYERLLD